MAKYSKKELSWIFYDWANSAYSITITTAILPVYFKSVFQNAGGSGSLSTAYWGYTNSVATLILAVMAPVLGSIADYYGYKKKFFTAFFLLGVVFTALLSIVPQTKWMLLLGFYVLTMVGFYGANVFYDAFLVDVTEEKRMDIVSSMGFGLGYIGSTIPFMASMALILLSQKGKISIPVITATKISFLITAGWWGLFSLPILKNVHQQYGIEPEPNPVRKSFARIRDTFHNIRRHRSAFMFLLAYFFYIDGVDTIIKMSTAYGTDLGISSSQLMIILLATQFVAFPFAILYGKLAERFPGKTMLFVGICIYTIICIYGFFLKNVRDFWILAMMVATSQGGMQALSRSYFGKLIPKEKSNEFFGFYNIFGKFAAIMGPLLMGVITQITGKSNYGVVSIILLFVIGGVLLKRVPAEEKSLTS
ncbi:MAG: MFS transporter [Peptostreptococcaceae bacterium]|nr:MFS transporter [Peptostreptococcaceae bacterium]